jgi:hypothetical protein
MPMQRPPHSRRFFPITNDVTLYNFSSINKRKNKLQIPLQFPSTKLIWHKTLLNVTADYRQFKKNNDVYRSTLQLINISTAVLKIAATVSTYLTARNYLS